jgi:hypothetical protein
MKRSGFKRPVYAPPPPAPPRRSSVRAAMVMSAVEPNPQPKSPADRNLKLRELARGEECTLQFPGGACDPETVVLAHSNELAENKGMGYKGNDSAGVFACYRCHKIIDQPGPSDPNEAQRLDCWQMAAMCTQLRLREIAANPSARPWKRLAAMEALMQLEARGVTG